MDQKGQDKQWICWKPQVLQQLALAEMPKKPGMLFHWILKGRRIAILNFADNEFLTAPGSTYTMQSYPSDS